jgi:hypothetical protein
MIQFEKEICEFLRLPSIPKKEWDGKSAFAKGVAVVKTSLGNLDYVAATFNTEKEEKPRIVKVFSQVPFDSIEQIFIVPDYMDTDVSDADLDEESKKHAEMLAKEAEEIENEGTEKEVSNPENEYLFDHIHNDDEARAYIASYNKTNKIKGRVPKTHEGLVMRLAVIYSETHKE